MEFTNEVLHKMQDKQKFNRQFQKWYYGMSEELKEVEPVRSDRIFNRGERIGSCLDYWLDPINMQVTPIRCISSE